MRDKIFQAVFLCGIVLSPSFAVVNNSSAEASRRQTHLSDSYGSPIPADSYGPPQKEDLGLPIPVYGAPDQVQYPAPPPDIPPPPGPPAAQYGPPAQSFNLAAGPPSQQYGPPAAHGPPSPEYGPPPGPPSPVYGPPPGPPKPVYGPPPGPSSHIQGPSKSYFGPPPSFNKPHFGPKFNYGPPPKPYYGPPPPFKQNYVGPSKPHYGPPPKPHYGPPLKEYFGSPPLKYGVPAQQYGPPNFKLNIPPNQSYGPPPNIPHVVYGSPKPNTSYGPPPGGLYGPPLIKPEPTPSVQYGPPPSPQYGPPPSPQYGPPTNYHELPPPPIIGPPKQGIPAPPTPPDIKYDGWKPIPGLSLPNLQHNHNDVQAHALLAPPNSYGLPIAEAVQFNNVPTDSYGAPISFGLNQGQTQVQTLHTSTLEGNDLPGLDLNIFGDQQQSVQSSNAIFEAHIIENIDGNSLLNQNLPQVQTIQLTSGHDEPLNVLQSDGLELFNNFNNDIKQNVLPPPLPEISNSYGVPQSSYFHQEGPYPPSGQPARLNFGKGIGLTPPSGIYGVPPGGHYSHGLALQHGTQSGNLAKGWNRGPPPRHPVSFRPPVPQGLIESIGYNVQHLDSLGFDLPSKENVYLPPPVAPPSQLNSLPQYSPPRQFYQAPSQHRECNSHGNQIDQRYQQQPYQQYGAPNQDLQSAHSVDTQLRASAPEIAPNKQTSEQHAEHSETVAVQKSVGVESESSAEDAPQYQAQTETQTTNQQHVDAQTQVLDQIQQVQDNQDDQTTQIQVQPSHAITLPLQGRLGTYSLQIQSADSLGSNDDGGQPPPHEQLLSEGLLQSILAAIEQPQQTASIGGIVQSKEYAQPLSTLDNNEVAVYLKDTSDQNEGNHE